MVRERLVGHRLVNDQVGFGEAGLDVPDAPLRACLPKGKGALRYGGEVLFRPLDGDEIPSDPGIPVETGVGAIRPQAVQGIQHERQGL